MFRFVLLILIAFTACGARHLHENQTAATQEYKQMDLVSLDGTPFDRAQLDGKVVLYVNVASRCGLTPQYDGLQALYDAKKDAGLVIVGVPCNQFAGQEPGTADEIQSFCRINYGVNFPLLEKQDVNGDDRSALYNYLVGSTAGEGRAIKWNFEKFVLDRKGHVIGRFRPHVQPRSKEMKSVIEKALAS